MSALVNRFGCRKVAVFGSVFASGSFVLAMYSPSIDILIVTYGIMGGNLLPVSRWHFVNTPIYNMRMYLKMLASTSVFIICNVM